MVITNRVGSIIQDLDVILRINIGEEKGDPAKYFRSPDTSEKAIRSNHFNYIKGPFYEGRALIDILEYLENRYNLDFDKLEAEYLKSNNMDTQ